MMVRYKCVHACMRARAYHHRFMGGKKKKEEGQPTQDQRHHKRNRNSRRTCSTTFTITRRCRNENGNSSRMDERQQNTMARVLLPFYFIALYFNSHTMQYKQPARACLCVCVCIIIGRMVADGMLLRTP